jgi:hypothetical protein|tara:strand:- start:308 stop:535 length:228 start_codon:yes stop_codon:yes gene_type:complete
MSYPTKSGKKYYEDQLKPFVGSTVEQIALDDRDEEAYVWGFKMSNNKVLWFLSDQEGNNGGSFDVTDLCVHGKEK